MHIIFLLQKKIISQNGDDRLYDRLSRKKRSPVTTSVPVCEQTTRVNVVDTHMQDAAAGETFGQKV